MFQEFTDLQTNNGFFRRADGRLRQIAPQGWAKRLLACLPGLFGLFCLLVSGGALALPRHSPVPGGIAILPLTGERAPTVSFDSRPQAVLRHDGRWFALIGIPLDTPPGRHEAIVESAGTRQTIAFTVVAKRYPTQHLRIPDQRMVEPPPELAMRIAEEQQRLTALKRHFSPDPMPETAFVLPAKGRLSARFGGRRVLNGEPRSPHAGLDVAVGIGQPVRASAGGKVLAIDNFYFAGSTVLIDHGQGLITLYAHLSQVDVEPGRILRRGDPVGRSGASGRATGPHLHWGVFVGGSAVDPELFLGSAH